MATAKVNPSKISSRPSQKSILAGVIRKRSANDSGNNGNGKSNDDNIPNKMSKSIETKTTCDGEKQENEIKQNSSNNGSSSAATTQKVDLTAYDKGALKCIGILPGIGRYRESSDSEKSTDTDDEYDFSGYDWVGRKIKKDYEDNCHE